MEISGATATPRGERLRKALRSRPLLGLTAIVLGSAALAF
jgi:hypothetical protein